MTLLRGFASHIALGEDYSLESIKVLNNERFSRWTTECKDALRELTYFRCWSLLIHTLLFIIMAQQGCLILLLMEDEV